MTAMTHDATTRAPASRFAAGLGFAVVSAFAFGMSGTLAKGLLDAGWTPAAAVTARIVVAAVVLLPPGLIALRGRWHLLAGNGRLLAGYGLVAVAGTQFAYFSAVQYLQVGVALLLEYAAPVVVIGWLWLRHGQRPSPLIGVGCVVAGGGLVLVLDVVTGAGLHPVGVSWALLAMLGVSAYFVLSAQEGNGLPPLVLASGGMVVGALSLLGLGAVGLLDMRWSTDPATYAGAEVPWWAAAVALGVLTAAVAYVTGIAAGRRLGSRLASFVALTEVLFALAAAWLVLDEVPGVVQFLGGALILAGVVLVKLGEPRSAAAASLSERPAS